MVKVIFWGMFRVSASYYPAIIITIINTYSKMAVKIKVLP